MGIVTLPLVYTSTCSETRVAHAHEIGRGDRRVRITIGISHPDAIELIGVRERQ